MTHAPGNHGLLDLYGCDEAILKDEGRLKLIKIKVLCHIRIGYKEAV